ncbi:hypothetical protein RB195_000421 [Necator americanus]|uniref:GTF3C1 extended winged-helix domain-containing protein n=1 Tax=Necator americanus TaxID=51031 RepID=A0ABR1D9N2_NECAM
MTGRSVDSICASLAQNSQESRKRKADQGEDADDVVADEASPEKLDSDDDFVDPGLSEGTASDADMSDSSDEVEACKEPQGLGLGTSKSTYLPSVVERTIMDKPKSKSKTRNKLSPLLDLLDVAPVVTTNFCSTGGTPYLSYNPEIWNPLFLYRLPADITLGAVRDCGTEGLGRAEIGKKMGMDTSTKAGNRRVSSYILTVCNEHPDHVGQFQKMEGKVRCIKYFWKAESQPEQFRKLFEDFERLSGVPCPFKLGQVVKFPNCNLSTLRMSDVTLRRLNDILELIANKRVVVTFHKISRYISEKEASNGYDFTIDKKSLVKCLKALEGVHLIRIFDTLVVAESVENKVQIVCHSGICSADDPEVLRAVQATIDEYHAEGRVFPHGQLRFSIKKRAELELEKNSSSVDPLTEINRVPYNTFLILLFLTSRSTVLSSKRAEVRVVSDRTEAKENNINDDSFFSDGEDLIGDGDRESLPKTHELTLESSMELVELIRASLPEEPSTGRANSESSAEYGYQTKAIRCFVLHEIAFSMVHGHKDGVKPTSFDLFPPGENFYSLPVRSVDELTVFVDEESPLRFLPPLPSFNDTARGWFMLQDLLISLPLSALVLIAHISRKVDKDLMLSYLTDPIKRHIPVGCLPNAIRIPIMKDQKLVRQVEHVLLTLCALGLMAIAPNPDPKCFSTARASVFYVSKKGVLYDTSTSGRGYASVTLPISNYDKYNYEFDSVDDVVLYWHHLRAIVQSTPLSFRNDVNSEEISQARHKKYSVGQFEKALVTVDPAEEIDELIPLRPHEGCAGFDSALYIHLKRHWDVDPRQNSYVCWFIARFRRQSDKIRKVVESRVANLKKDWNSYMKSLMPSEMELTKSKKLKNAGVPESLYTATRGTLSIDPIKKRPPVKKQGAKKKRPLDSVDIISEQNRLHLRSRFNSRERDMLIMIRAVGFFLNPVYRFWLDPAVVRDIMHEYIPESRSKTVQSLMAAGVREMVRPSQLAYLQRIVRNLSTFQEMRDLRFQMASEPLSTSESKTTFFRNAFDVANRLLFIEHQALPVAATSNKQFEAFLKSSRMVISSEQSIASPIPLRSQTPTSLDHIHHCVAVNILLSILIHSTDGAFSESILDQISAAVISNALQVLRSDGLVSRSRALDPQLMVITKNQAILSYYFRHFFSHRFHPDIVEQTMSVFNALDDSVEGNEELQGDLAGALVAASSSFCNKSYLELLVDDDVFSMFDQAVLDQGAQSIKQIRYLENADLHLEQIHVYAGCGPDLPTLPTWQSLLATIDWSQPAEKHPPAPFEEWLLDTAVSERMNLRSVYKPISSAGAFGATLEDIKCSTDLTSESIKEALTGLCNACQIIPVGVDTYRWIAAEYASAWCVKVAGKLVCPRPWTMPTGELCPATVRWMSESVLMTIISSPAITLKEVCTRLEFAVQSVAVHDLVNVLVGAGCVKKVEEDFEDMKLSSPFQKEYSQRPVTYLLPLADCLETFARIFGGISLLPAMTGRSETDKEEEPKEAARNNNEPKEMRATISSV